LITSNKLFSDPAYLFTFGPDFLQFLQGSGGIILHWDQLPPVIAAQNFDVVAEIDDFFGTRKKDIRVFFAILIDVFVRRTLKPLSKEVERKEVFLGQAVELSEQKIDGMG